MTLGSCLHRRVRSSFYFSPSSCNRSPCAAATPLRERIYADTVAQLFGILLYTGSPNAEGTLGGLVQQARHIEDHLAQALRMSALCSNDPVCAQHVPGGSLEGRWLHGAACRGCALVAETSKAASCWISISANYSLALAMCVTGADDG